MKQEIDNLGSYLIRPLKILWHHRALELIPFILLCIILWITAELLRQNLVEYVTSLQHKLNLTELMEARLTEFGTFIIYLLAILAIIPSIILPAACDSQFNFFTYSKRLPLAIGRTIQLSLLSLLNLRVYLALILSFILIPLAANHVEALYFEILLILYIFFLAFFLCNILLLPFISGLLQDSSQIRFFIGKFDLADKIRFLVQLGLIIAVMIEITELHSLISRYLFAGILGLVFWYGVALIATFLSTRRHPQSN